MQYRSRTIDQIECTRSNSHRLSWVKQNYFRAETLTNANARLVNFHIKQPLTNAWGDGNVASADGMRLISSAKIVNAGPNRKFFDAGRGITWYNFISDKYSGFHGIVVTGTLRDSLYVLEGILEQQTGLNLADTAGASDIIFGLRVPVLPSVGGCERSGILASR
ncbi:hypothetical protein H735_18690 [Vibrio owensii CAIM 1854 = LMG 25443]|uniref:Tn3 transposase DDE domain-containing protein n=1 Tax=Vibrio owensii CAIM 1854 = LMG 25443 TaxID=1229493 RepID=A0A0C1Z3E2_9VIBR|nr:hypothetical protein H735_18690 [Vibrio owensii CAIM 1854 = LMG 25443]